MHKKRKLLIKFEFLFMNHWGSIYLLPNIEVSITYSIPTIILQWWVFRLDIHIYRRLPDWFMEHVWSVINLDFLKKNENEFEE